MSDPTIEQPRRPLWRLVLIVSALTGLVAIVAVQWHLERLGGVGPGRYRLLTLILVWQALAMVVATLLRWIRPRRVAAGLIIASLVALPAASLTRGSQISDDLYRYAWDGRLQAAGVDPYRYPPDARQLAKFSLKLRLAYRSVRRREKAADGRDGLVAPEPGPQTITRRGVVAVAGGSSLVVAGLYAGQTIGGPFRVTALLSPRGGPGSPSFPVNRTARTARVTRVGDEWRLTLVGTHTLSLSRADLLAMRHVTAGLPIACVEGWSSTQTWTGVPLTALGRLVGLTTPVGAYVESLEQKGAYRHVSLSRHQVGAAHTLLALKCAGQDLTLDHGYPARLIIPAAPGVHNTKWVSKVTFDV